MPDWFLYVLIALGAVAAGGITVGALLGFCLTIFNIGCDDEHATSFDRREGP